MFGLVPTLSLGIEHLYYVSFIDDFSRKTWIHFLQHKFGGFSEFKEFKAKL